MAATAKRKPFLPDLKTPIDLLGLVEMIRAHLTDTLCEEVFLENRTVERQREWSLHALASFWLAVTIRAPKALRHALAEGRSGRDALLPHVETTDEAFFQKCKGMHWSFFAELFARLSARLLGEASVAYGAQAMDLRKHFPEIWAMDGSQLGEVAKRLKILREVKAAVLPGRIFVHYDLFRGVCRTLRFEGNAARNENLLAKEAFDDVPKGTLLLADRLYGMPGYFQELGRRGLWGLFRRHGGAKVEVIEELSRIEVDGSVVVDLLVTLGRGERGIKRQTVRMIRSRRGRMVLDLFTNVLDTKKLPALRAVELYGLRWSIERMFFDLKEVLNLNRFYAANPNAIAMQIYAAAMVYNAFRIAQGRIAVAQRLPGESLSSAKLYPKLAAASARGTDCEFGWLATVQANPGVKLNKPDFRQFSFSWTTLRSILVEKKHKPRTLGTPNPRSTWLSFAHVPGGQELLTRKTA